MLSFSNWKRVLYYYHRFMFLRCLSRSLAHSLTHLPIPRFPFSIVLLISHCLYIFSSFFPSKYYYTEHSTIIITCNSCFGIAMNRLKNLCGWHTVSQLQQHINPLYTHTHHFANQKAFTFNAFAMKMESTERATNKDKARIK